MGVDGCELRVVRTEGLSASDDEIDWAVRAQGEPGPECGFFTGAFDNIKFLDQLGKDELTFHECKGLTNALVSASIKGEIGGIVACFDFCRTEIIEVEDFRIFPEIAMAMDGKRTIKDESVGWNSITVDGVFVHRAFK